MVGRWTYCYNRHGKDYERFIRTYFGRPGARILLICGSGFDPRATIIPELIAAAAQAATMAWLIREERPNAVRRLREAAEGNMARLQELFPEPNHRILQFDIFASDGAVVAGSNLIKIISVESVTMYTDIIVDTSSLSVGVAFPLVAWLHQLATKSGMLNVHLAVTSNPDLDAAIQFTASDKVQSPRGFAYGSHANQPEAKMWIPQLQVGQNQSLEKIFRAVAPQDVCPILPFPTSLLRTPEELIVSYGDLFDEWDVDASNVIYSTEDRPLDIYRTIARIQAERREVFKVLGPSEIIITPMGSKVIAMGALLAALEFNLTVQYVEAEGFIMDPIDLKSPASTPMGLWLYGGPVWLPTK